MSTICSFYSYVSISFSLYTRTSLGDFRDLLLTKYRTAADNQSLYFILFSFLVIGEKVMSIILKQWTKKYIVQQVWQQYEAMYRQAPMLMVMHRDILFDKSSHVVFHLDAKSPNVTDTADPLSPGTTAAVQPDTNRDQTNRSLAKMFSDNYRKSIRICSMSTDTSGSDKLVDEVFESGYAAVHAVGSHDVSEVQVLTMHCTRRRDGHSLRWNRSRWFRWGRCLPWQANSTRWSVFCCKEDSNIYGSPLAQSRHDAATESSFSTSF